MLWLYYSLLPILTPSCLLLIPFIVNVILFNYLFINLHLSCCCISVVAGI